MNILEQLWYGNINPNEQGDFWRSECKDLLQMYNRNSAKLAAILNDQDKETLEKLHECQLEMQQYAECGAFITGFRLGVRLMAAAMEQ